MNENLEAVPPGEILFEEYMQPFSVSQNRLARDLDVPPGRINEIVNGKRTITADTALRLAKYFGTSAEMWLNLQMEYDLRVIRQRDWPKIEPRIRKLDAA
jgi:addiction module HigA family antidote